MQRLSLKLFELDNKVRDRMTIESRFDSFIKFVVVNNKEGSSPSEVGTTLGICGVNQCRPHLAPKPLAYTPR